MKRDAVYYVMPLGEIWLVRAIGSSAEAYPTLEDALAAAERLAARGAHVRVLSRADQFHALELAEGRFFTDAEAARGALVIVVSHKLAEELAPDRDPTRILGAELRVDGTTLTVIGRLAAYEGETASTAYVPFAAAPRIFPPVDAARPVTMMLRATS